ncbi:PoNe immunity protein domain-containing protein [Listeria innocua]|uniref:PoNe immunity protein domain-containing protein n=1 Tax=Listeria innocua TaxID=1642 RepID=UPI0016236FF4|nr:PoNe immunity protein domain-containing protein [Listeria innocua]MBC1925536.1 DUF1911 domain-containing protein [Listeria innocua]
MRDTLKSKEYFDAYINRELQTIEFFSSSLENNDQPDNIERIERLQRGITGALVKIIHARYSRGDKVSDIKPQMDEVIRRSLTSSQPHENYNETLYMLAYIILFNEPRDLLGEFRSLFFKNPDKKIPAVDGLLDFLTTGEKNDEGLIWKKQFDRLWQVVLSDSPEEQNKRLTDFMKRWYGSKKGNFWYNEHKKSSLDDMDFATYKGYWCWEAGAVAKLLNIPDENLKDHPNYPYDLVHFKDDKGETK